ncbi:monovalent cation/H(+) antiporter subunit G [uncultured Brevundimonas sp.]|uniref:monovalent cation/H(+) antiporter subunit G n=1 Tax=uncultured Brevundimonas sp. TaxID=213418 RepID=UPI002618FD8D|nr:monovalent cation/H(+) antiporter subunit G [uncultured Brevundimonas sp.]
MNTPAHLPDIPMWIAVLVTALSVAGALVALIGSIGLRRMKTMYDRIHAPAITATLAMILIMLAMIVYFSTVSGRLDLKALLIGIFFTVTTPVTMVLLARASIYRDRVEGNDVPKDDM